jgi:hypothetical protein
MEPLSARRGDASLPSSGRQRPPDSLGETIVLPKDLVDGLDDLRQLGNDNAHVESKTINEVGQEEVEAAIEFAKGRCRKLSHRRLST